MIDEKLRVIRRDHPPDPLHGGDRCGLIRIQRRYRVLLKILLEMNDVSGQDDEA